MSHHSRDKSLVDQTRNLDESDDGTFKREKSAIMTGPNMAAQVAALQKQIDETLGPTGEHPAGKLVPHDEGGLMFGVTVFNGRVILDFGKPIRSIGFTRNDALELAKILRKRAKDCPPIIGEPEPKE